MHRTASKDAFSVLSGDQGADSLVFSGVKRRHPSAATPPLCDIAISTVTATSPSAAKAVAASAAPLHWIPYSAKSCGFQTLRHTIAIDPDIDSDTYNVNVTDNVNDNVNDNDKYPISKSDDSLTRDATAFSCEAQSRNRNEPQKRICGSNENVARDCACACACACNRGDATFNRERASSFCSIATSESKLASAPTRAKTQELLERKKMEKTFASVSESEFQSVSDADADANSDSDTNSDSASATLPMQSQDSLGNESPLAFSHAQVGSETLSSGNESEGTKPSSLSAVAPSANGSVPALDSALAACCDGIVAKTAAFAAQLAPTTPYDPPEMHGVARLARLGSFAHAMHLLQCKLRADAQFMLLVRLLIELCAYTSASAAAFDALAGIEAHMKRDMVVAGSSSGAGSGARAEAREGDEPTWGGIAFACVVTLLSSLLEYDGIVETVQHVESSDCIRSVGPSAMQMQAIESPTTHAHAVYAQAQVQAHAQAQAPIPISISTSIPTTAIGTGSGVKVTVRTRSESFAFMHTDMSATQVLQKALRAWRAQHTDGWFRPVSVVSSQKKHQNATTSQPQF